MEYEAELLQRRQSRVVLTHERREDNLFGAVIPLSVGPSMARSLLTADSEPDG
jgi:hypothetical protein